MANAWSGACGRTPACAAARRRGWAKSACSNCTTDMTRCGSFINLDRSADRRTAMQAQLDALGLDGVQRLRATDGAALAVPAASRITAGEYGCFVSHLQ